MENRIDTVIVDDDNPSIRLLADRLKAYPDVRVVATAGNGEEGWNTVLRYKPDLLFLDVELSDTSGLEFLSSLDRHIDWDMKVVFYTSYEKYLLPALRLQAFDYLLKPVSDSELSLIMDRYYLLRDESRRMVVPPSIPSPSPMQSINLPPPWALTEVPPPIWAIIKFISSYFLPCSSAYLIAIAWLFKR